MAFWGVEVKPGKPFTLKAATNDAKRLHLSQATLGLSSSGTNRSILQCNVGNKSPLFLCVLSPEKVDSCQLNIEFQEAEDVIFSVIGPRSVHLTGYFLGRSSTAGLSLNDDESESFGEDIVDTDVEKGSSDDYDYSDSFINDDADHPSSTDDDDLTVKERVAKTKAKEGKKRLRKKFQVSDSDSDETSARAASEDSVEILNGDNDHKTPKVLSSEVPLPSRVTRSKARCSTLENGVEVKPGKPFTLKAATNDAKRLHLSQATLGLVSSGTNRSILQCNVGNKSPLFLCVLSPEKVDSCQLNIEYSEEGLKMENVPKNSWLVYEVEAVKVR
ncbi:hypothetical protein F2Q69_00016298 [Brassica cretica]|uniref:peptidylprolyl isomerase n=1 Tax=Brassica cretica TaxID=69181 RepID=A0A8S9QSE4_BRACR|nr:hypothetical protein F2Q69_00016298 [Brassica cretica]